MSPPRASLFWILLLSLSVAPLSGLALQDGDPKEKAQIQAAIKTARVYIESGKRSSAERLLKDIVLVYPKHPATEEARKLLSSLSSPGGAGPRRSIPGKAIVPPKSASGLLLALRKACAQARTLQLKYTLDCPADALPFTGSGELKVNGKTQWRIDFKAKNKAGRTGRMKAWSDGRTLYSKGFQGRSSRPSSQPATQVRQLREYGSTSFIPLFYALLYQKLDEDQDYTSKTSNVKDLGKETVQGRAARKLEYTVSYLTGKSVRVVAWIDEERIIPLKREVHFGGPVPLTETITSYTIGAAIPASDFAAPK